MNDDADAPRGTPPGDDEDGRHLKILIVEDVPEDADLEVRTLRKAGFSVDWKRVETRGDFTEALNQFGPDLILSDYRLPEFDGMSALHIAQDVAPDLPFVIITGSLNEETAVECMKAGADDYVLKEHLGRLPPVLRNAMGKRRVAAEKARAEEALRESQLTLQGILQSTADGILAVNNENRVLYASNRFVELWTIPPALVARMDDGLLLQYVLDQLVDPQGFLQKVQDLYHSRETSFDTLHFRDGRVFERLSRPLMQGAALCGRVWSFRDITERMGAEKALQKSEQRYRLLFERNVAGVFITTLEGQILVCNAAFAQMLGYDTPSEVASQPALSLYAHAEDREAFTRAIVHEQRLVNFEFRGKRKDGTPFFGLENVTLIEDEEGPRLLEGTVIDITNRKQAEERIHLQLRRLAGLRAVDSAIATSLDAGVAFNLCIGEAIAQLQVDAASILLANSPARALECAAAQGFESDAVWRLRWPFDEVSMDTSRERWTFFVPDAMTTAEDFPRRELLKRERLRAYFATPFYVKGQFKGLLEVFHRGPLNPDQEWMDFLASLGGQAGIALDNASLFENLQRSNRELALAYDTTLEGWTHALEMRDRETKGHTLRSAEMTVRLARAMGLPEQDLLHIRRGALLHDIGKMGIPDAILLKPGPLTEEEWHIMRRHPEHAHTLLSSIGYLSPALDIPYCHHERWDGTGYPRGLKGEAIPVAARIFSVVDAWDALSFVRPYRPAWPKDRVLAHITKSAGSHFDPEIVAAFMDLVRD